MSSRRDFPKQKFAAAFILTLFIFLLVLVTNSFLNDAKLNRLNSIYDDLRIDTLNAELQYALLSENPCLALNFKPLNNELFELGNKLTYMEEQQGKKNQQVLSLKKYYSILEARHWLFIKKASQECNTNATPILYFYSNEPDCKNCETQGFVFSYVKKVMPDILVYSFDVNLDSSAIYTLKINYNVTTTPSFVINEKTYSGYKDSEELIAILSNNS